MKKYINVALVVIALLSITALFYSFISIDKASADTAVSFYDDAGVKFGRGPDCSGPRGMCSVEEDSDGSKLEGSDAKASFLVDEDGKLIMEIIKTSIIDEEMKAQFEEDFFEFDKSVIIPNQIIEPLGIEGNDREGLIIFEGQYRIIEKEDSYSIIILE